MKNWKTTIAGLILAASLGIAQADPATVGTRANKWAGFAAVIAAALLGVSAKDKDVTGGTREQ
jgi:ABC-type Fe3+-siderophore transport system permease subunit